MFCFGRLAVSVEDVDFVDPALADQPDVRERGARVELRPVKAVDVNDASIYASQTVTGGPAMCRLDFLESVPHAADRMHWHPAMARGEPDERTFDEALSADPIGWLRTRLIDGAAFLRDAGVSDPRPYEADLAALAAGADDVVAQVERVLERARRPWPEAPARDERGMALTT